MEHASVERWGHRTWFQQNRLVWGIILVLVFSLGRFSQTVMWRRWFDSPDFQTSVAFVFFLLLWFLLMAIGLIAGGIVWLTGTSWRELGWRREGAVKAIGLGFLGFILIYINVVVWAMLGGNMEPPETLVPSLSRILVVAFFAFGLAAWVEENLYRGYLQPLLAEKVGGGQAIVWQAVIFSVAHLGYLGHFIEFAAAFVTGVILGWLRERSGGIVAPYVAHGLFWMLGAFMVVSP